MPSVKSHHLGDMVFATQVGNHKILNDVPLTPDWGGKDRHPTPPDYFIASISSCVAAFVVQYCHQVGFDAADMIVETSFEKATNPAHMHSIAINVTLPNADVGERREAIKRVCRHCTVHETISRMGEVNITVVDKTS